MLKTYFWSLDMENEIVIHNENQPQLDIESKILVIRGQQVMLDGDLAIIYGYEVKYLNRQVKRNIERFPEDFMFQLTREEYDILRCQNVTAIKNTMSRSMPYAFTEQGVAMLSGILRSKIAIATSIKIIETFVSMRKYQNKRIPCILFIHFPFQR